MWDVFMFRRNLVLILVILFAGGGFALSPDQILVLVNADNAESVELGRYYCQKRGVSEDDIIELSLGNRLERVSRADYDRLIAEPVREAIEKRDGRIRCLVTTYGMAYDVGARGVLPGKESELRELTSQLEAVQRELESEKSRSRPDSNSISQLETLAARLKIQTDILKGAETRASVDSELSMVMFDDYELYRWQPNNLKGKRQWDGRTMMVSRLDGPSIEIARGLIDKAIATEKRGGLKGKAYIDSRGLAADPNPGAYGYYDQSLRELATFARLIGKMETVHDDKPALFPPNSCPDAAIYCGWYSVRKYVDSFEWVEGAVGYHIASWEAQDLRNADSPHWVPSMLSRGITATIGPVFEPYLHAFPEPKWFFHELFRGSTLVEAYYFTNNCNSWQMVLIGDPLYRPFKGN